MANGLHIGVLRQAQTTQEMTTNTGGIMKNICALLLLLGASFTAFSQSAPAAPTEATDPPFKLTISAYQGNGFDAENTANQVMKGSFSLSIHKTNTSDHEIIKLSDAAGASGYMYDVRDSSGNIVEYKKHNNMIDGKMMTSDGENRITGTKDMVLQPGESKVNFEPLGSWYEIDKPGTYTIQVSEHVSNDPASDVVKSNKITITVLPPDPPADEPK
jgi:hypothetical protein